MPTVSENNRDSNSGDNLDINIEPVLLIPRSCRLHLQNYTNVKLSNIFNCVVRLSPAYFVLLYVLFSNQNSPQKKAYEGYLATDRQEYRKSWDQVGQFGMVFLRRQTLVRCAGIGRAAGETNSIGNL